VSLEDWADPEGGADPKVRARVPVPTNRLLGGQRECLLRANSTRLLLAIAGPKPRGAFGGWAGPLGSLHRAVPHLDNINLTKSTCLINSLLCQRVRRPCRCFHRPLPRPSVPWVKISL
jgi:hypothetical protein